MKQRDSDESTTDGEEGLSDGSGGLSSWVLDLRAKFADRAPMVLPAGIEGSDDLPRVVHLIVLCVLDEQLCTVLTLDDDFAPDTQVEVLQARLVSREALVDGETGEDPAADWFAPMEWDEPLGEPGDDEEAASDAPAVDPVWGAATALVRDFYTEDVATALQVGELDDQLLLERRCAGCVVALPRTTVRDLLERESVMVVPLPRLLEPDHMEMETVPASHATESEELSPLRTIYIDNRRIPGVSVALLDSLLARLGLRDDLSEIQ